MNEQHYVVNDKPVQRLESATAPFAAATQSPFRNTRH